MTREEAIESINQFILFDELMRLGERDLAYLLLGVDLKQK